MGWVGSPSATCFIPTEYVHPRHGESMKFIDTPKAFATTSSASHTSKLCAWPHGMCCSICGAQEVSKITRKSKSENVRAQLYQCLEKSCKSQFSATSGMIFHDSHLALSKWDYRDCADILWLHIHEPSGFSTVPALLGSADRNDLSNRLRSVIECSRALRGGDGSRRVSPRAQTATSMVWP